MNLKLATLDDPEEARRLAPLLERAAAETGRASLDEPLPPGTIERFLARHAGRPQTLLLVARAAEDEDPVAVCLTAPLEDPLTGEVRPVVVALWVEPELRHRGLARALIREARRRLGTRGLADLAARVSYNDDALISMGERWGFVRTWELMVQE